MTTGRDDRHRKNAERMRPVLIALGAEVVAKGGSLDRFPQLRPDEVAEIEARAVTFFRDRAVEVARQTRDDVSRARRMDRSASTETHL